METFDQGEEIKVGKANLGDNHVGITFTGKDDATTYDIDGLIPDDKGNLVGRVTIGDKDGPIMEPVPVLLPKGEVHEARPLRIFLHEHGKELGAGAATLVVVAVGSLLIRKRNRT